MLDSIAIIALAVVAVLSLVKRAPGTVVKLTIVNRDLYGEIPDSDEEPEEADAEDWWKRSRN